MWWREVSGGGNGELSKQKCYCGTHGDGRSSEDSVGVSGNPFIVCLP